ncbi:hypothetical protein V5799_020079, partial [Amblyomma americanum]
NATNAWPNLGAGNGVLSGTLKRGYRFGEFKFSSLNSSDEACSTVKHGAEARKWLLRHKTQLKARIYSLAMSKAMCPRTVEQKICQ